MDINFELYKVFYFVVVTGSFSEAAQKLYISQSAVSQTIRKLEEKMNARLFLRGKRNVKLTSEGEVLFTHVEQAFNFIKTAENKIFEMQSLDSGEVRIGASDTVCKYYLVKYLEKYNMNYPKIKIQVINRTSAQITSLLKSGMIDFGVVTLPAHDKSISVKEIGEVEDIFVASDKFLPLKNKKVSLDELSRYPLLLLQKDSATRNHLDRFLEKLNIKATPEIELESVDLLVEFSRIGLGIAHVLKQSAANLIEKGDLFEVETDVKLPPRKLGVIAMDNVPLSRASGEFIRSLEIKWNVKL